MNCHVCDRGPNSQHHLLCPTCTRNQLYPLRFDHARVLLEKEAIGKKIKAAVATENTYDTESVENGCLGDLRAKERPSRWAIQAAKSRVSQSTVRTSDIFDRMTTLREEIREGKENITHRKALLKQRRSDMESATYQVTDRRASMLATVQDSIKRTEHLWNSLHNKTAQSRVFLCREVANLYRLRQRTRRKNGELIAVYTIGGVSIVDLRDLNSANHLLITTSLTYISHLLVLVSHYLSLRLPAEITLPHRNYPLPTIFPPSSSYLSQETAFPGASPSQSSSSSPTASRTTDTRPPPRPRPLYVNKSLPKLAHEDPATYGLFLEGVALLAWNIYWLCRTQGLHVGVDSWEDVYDIGRNLWMLLVAQPSHVSAISRVLSNRDTQAKLHSSNKDDSKPTIQRNRPSPMLGHYSHGTAHSFLGSAEGTEFMRKWKQPSTAKVVDKLKSVLLGEMTSAEWELLDKTEWEDEYSQRHILPEGEEEPAPAATKSPSGVMDGVLSDAASSLAAKPLDDDNHGNEDTTNNHRLKGTRGWTKLKNR
ncbi:conserved hypothetical protein [Histoplasma capsulatum G186AR]|uniref:Autophagy-related protein 14 n=2 Tax=Ajellomyces capsulatus TaxID=5037 RepID=C0NNR8_AJECG|nr:uncharacterized protein HCBG_04798 [Histoplasma capsulatum G186AR]EEH06578.1 conserved hypothetical protein [Histoplasma capsulatum G186AR]KAG5304894.1 hypothetical protein I7I52_03387 [Histoplasma capsulatum]QSS75853.1 hypothetical protein I7I50_05129 [Histoplasma capsulatum G186AR]